MAGISLRIASDRCGGEAARSAVSSRPNTGGANASWSVGSSGPSGCAANWMSSSIGSACMAPPSHAAPGAVELEGGQPRADLRPHALAVGLGAGAHGLLDELE